MDDPILMPTTRMHRLLDALRRDGTLEEVGRVLQAEAIRDGVATLSHQELHRAVEAMPASAQRHFEQLEASLLRDYDRMPMRPVAMMAAPMQVGSVNRILRQHGLPEMDRAIVRQVLGAHGR